MMNLVVLFLLLLRVASVQSQVIFTECLADWVGYSGHCYKFIGYPRLQTVAASGYCQKDGATLISVNDIQENSFVINWLEINDGARDTWLTSGTVTKEPEGVAWLGDGTTALNLNEWHNNVTPDRRVNGDPVVYSFNGVEYGWSVGGSDRNTSFICEIALQDIYKIVEAKRNFDYGLPISNPELAPRGPKFLAQPVPTVVMMDQFTPPVTAADFDCLADGNPRPEYEWVKSNGTGMVPLVVGPGSQYTMTAGQLTITYPRGVNEGTYQCRAMNELGSILSTPITLTFATLGQFSNVPTADVNGLVSDGAALECPTITSKPRPFYNWYKGNMQFIRPEFQPHTFISNNGKLYFSELALSDADTYHCQVLISRRGDEENYIGSTLARDSLGFRLNVNKGVSSEFRPVIQDDFIKVYPSIPKRGQDIEMECFAYGTLPLEYRWFRDGKEMPPTASYIFSNRVLKIENVQIEDGGQYRCRVDSRRTSQFAEKRFTLNVQSDPYFSYPLQDQHADVGSRLNWHCEARGMPTPTYNWYKNGKQIVNSTDVKVVGNTLIIESLQKERDDGMYQCSARNLHGVAFSSAQIRVLEFAPTFAKRPVDASLMASVGGNITIICDPEAAPAPTYKWLRNGADIGVVQGGAPNGPFQMLRNGNLLITGVTNQHQGTYTCNVKNPSGEDSSTGRLWVYSTTVISQRPRNVQQQVNGTAALVCVASSPPNIDVVYVWKFNDHIINFAQDVEYEQGTGSTAGILYVKQVQYKNEGIYTCQVTTGVDTISASAVLTVIGPPGEPTGLFKGENVGENTDNLSLNDRFVRLYWSDGLTYGGPILAYTMEFRTNFDMTWRVHPAADKVEARFAQSVRFPDKRTLLLRDLKPYAGHQFRVRALNMYGIGTPSIPTIMIQIPGAPPVLPPLGLTGGGGKVGDLAIRWQPLPVEDYNGPDFRYLVNWRRQSSSQADDSLWQSKEVRPDEVCKQIPDIDKGLISVCSITALVGEQFFYLPFETRIRAVNRYGQGTLSGIVVVMSAEGMPTATPRNVYSIGYNGTALDVYWNPVSNTREELKGRLLGYRINYWHRDTEIEEQARFNIVQIPPGESNLDHGVIIGLFPAQWYVCNVQVITSAGYGPKSEDFPQSTHNAPPALYPTEVHVYSIEGVGVRVEFRGISTKIGEEPLVGYKLQYWPSGENIRKARNLEIGRTPNVGYITNLTQSVLYELRIFGFSLGGQGQRSSPTVYFTVGDGQVQFNPETTEVMAGSSVLQSSFYVSLFALLFAFFTSWQ